MTAQAGLAIRLSSSADLKPAERRDVIALCSEAYGQDLESYFRHVGRGRHVLGMLDRRLVAHAMWVTRFLQPEGMKRLLTAYVELVATSPEFRGRGFATRLMERIRSECQEFEIAALSSAGTTLYDRLGWEDWCGDLYIRTADGLQPTPAERIKILRLPKTPREVSLDADLSAEWRPGELW